MLNLIILTAPHLNGDLYLDPGSGSYILQLLLAALLGGAFALKIFWKRIVAFFNKSKGVSSMAVEEEDQQLDD